MVWKRKMQEADLSPDLVTVYQIEEGLTGESMEGSKSLEPVI
ncbi:hypothetical protein ACSFXN_07050 [Planococcus sp. 1R117A]